MNKTAAELRHHELTQEIYNIGDEVADYLEHIIEALADWDRELIEDSLLEFTEILEDARLDSRRITAELTGLRQALTSGLRAGTVNFQPDLGAVGVAKPAELDTGTLRRDYPITARPVIVRELTRALNGRTEQVIEHLEDLVQWTLHQTALVANDLNAPSLPLVYQQVRTRVDSAVGAWVESVAEEHPGYTLAMRGTNPPSFLTERARVDGIVAKVAEKRAAARRAISGGGYAS
ncbi:hypothetical protein COCCU_10060 [Corynebacterium occultum]|uniref:Uncharacterized protein n=1 Tax=Corynebacterium occultum TaxID=2675219 RepID=A0A6B8W5S6_9CORY|nr:hypothetical protein [Corynebacterium occultum]QGU07931.1 hypothetical protein COCCU_10060 [Corynebacterium occultum]